MKRLLAPLSMLGLLAALSIGLAGCGGGGDAGIDEEIDVSDPVPTGDEGSMESADLAVEEVPDSADDPEAGAEAAPDSGSVPVDPEPAEPGFGDPAP